MALRTVAVTRTYVHGHDEAEIVLNDNESIVRVESQDDGGGLYVYIVRDDGRPGRGR